MPSKETSAISIPTQNTRLDLGLRLLECMTRIREFELRAKEMQAKGEIPSTLHLSIGQEAIAAGVCHPLRRGDYVASTHRGHGHCIAKGTGTAAMMAELYGRATGTCGGKGGSMHIADFSVGMLGSNGVVGGGIGIAVGAAQASRLLKLNCISVCFFGDGAVNRGPFLEGLNWSRIFDLPVLFVCEDNGFAAYTRPTQTTGGPGAVARAESLGLRAAAVDGNDAFAVHDAAAALIDHCRSGRGPCFLYAPTYRLEGHTVADKTPYRTSGEVEEKRRRDPIAILSARLAQFGADASDLEVQAAKIRREIEAAVEFARSSPWPSPDCAFSDVQDAGEPP
jgi:pyruvate dehydrogenase E1 component alpha subunit